MCHNEWYSSIMRSMVKFRTIKQFYPLYFHTRLCSVFYVLVLTRWKQLTNKQQSITEIVINGNLNVKSIHKCKGTNKFGCFTYKRFCLQDSNLIYLVHCPFLYETLTAVCYHLYNLKNVKSSHGGVLLLVFHVF